MAENEEKFEDENIPEEDIIKMIDGELDIPDLDEEEESESKVGDDQKEDLEEGDEKEKEESPDKEGDGEDQKPEIETKDGKHTIPYDVLASTREELQEWKEIAKQKDELLRQQLGSKDDGGDDQSDKGAEKTFEDLMGMSDEEFEEFKEDYPAAAKVFESMAERLKAIEETAQKVQADTHKDVIVSAHPDVEEIITSGKLMDWIKEQPSFMRDRLVDVYKNGSAPEVVEMLDVFKNQTQPVGDTTGDDNSKKTMTDKEKEEALAKKLKDKDKDDVPLSLSDAPGSRAHHDVGEAMLEMTPEVLMDKFSGKSQEEIEAMLERVL